MKISDLIFSKYVGNTLPQAKMIEVEKQLIEDDEARLAIHASIVDFEQNMDRAEELLGDVDVVTNQVKNVQNNDRNELMLSSNKVNEHLFTKSRIKMEMKLTKDEALKVQELVTAFNESYDETVTLDENLSKFFMNQCPGTFPEDALDVVKGLRSGIDMFNANFQKSLSEQGFDYASELRGLSSELPMEKRYEIYINFLAAITTLCSNNMAEGEMFEVDKFQEIRGSLSPVGNVTEEMLIDVEQRIAEVLDNNTVCLGNLDVLRQLISSLPEGAEAIEKAITGSEEDVKQKLVISMATYILIMKGEVESVKAEEITPEMIGMSSSMGVEQAYVLEDLRAGRITVDKAIKILKTLGGILLYTLLMALVILFTIDMVSFTTAWMGLLVGTSFVANILAMVVSCIVMWKISEALGDLVDGTVNVMSDVFDFVVDVWRNRAWPGFKSLIEGISSWFSTRLSNETIAVQNDENVQQNNLAIQ